ncbi:MAG: Hsp70 family protein, partial [Clostridia bacterium]|nr:Hsp70 family protein [Clostridia bacterium]
MRYIGIDLGTTNSVIASFDGSETRVFKSPEQNDVTPSAIYVDRHGHRFFGRRAYEMAPADEKNAVTLFKRYLGTNMTFTLENTGETLTPEACGAEILRLLAGYLPEDWQSDTGTVITVPAAFNQVKKDATMKAAELAHLGNVALMQEPVAAVMSVMKQANDGIFLIYDLGGGTFDISVAEYVGNHVNLLAQGGKEMCGGRDWDRLLWREIVYPWLRQHFHLPDDADRSQAYRRLRQLALFACEQGKVELSMRESSCIQMDERMIGQTDLDGREIYLDVEITRDQLTRLIDDLMLTTVQVTRETIRKAGIRQEDIRKIVFIGGPTVYPPLQEYVMGALGISEKGEANPMTAVAEGAAIYAESIDWSSQLHGRQGNVEQASESDYEIRYERRVSADKARVAIIHKGTERFQAEITSEMDGWVSGKTSFTGRGVLTVPLTVRGENHFRIHLYDREGRQVPISSDLLTIHHVLATVKAIPASQTIALKVLDRVGGRAVPVYLIRENEQLPKRGTVTLHAGQRLVAGSNASLVFTLWEGDIVDPIEDNRYIGTYRIPGVSFSSGVIAVGADILCEYEINEAGHLRLGVTVPSVGAVFASQNFYSSKEGTTD